MLPLFVRIPKESLTIGGSLAIAAKTDSMQRIRRFKEERRSSASAVGSALTRNGRCSAISQEWSSADA